MIGTCLRSWNAAAEEDVEDGPDDSDVIVVMVRHYYGYRSTKNTTDNHKEVTEVKSYQKHIDSVMSNFWESYKLFH